jgi:hypothetical protein
VRFFKIDGLSWKNRCEQHLDDLELQRVLHRDFGLFVIGRYGTIKRPDQFPGHFETWDARTRRRPPYWLYVKDLACHYLVNFNLRLAMLTAPEHPWRIITSNLHSTVWDGGDMLFDLNSFAGQRPDQVFLVADGDRGELERRLSAVWDSRVRARLPAGYRITYAEHFPIGQYMPVAIFFPPAGDDALWAQWQEGVERTPALRRALMKGFRRGHFANKPKPDRERAEAVLNRMMMRDPAEDLAA